MYKAVEEALAGNFRYDPGHLALTPETLELSLHEGGKLTGSFRIEGAPGLPLSGSVMCFDTRMKLSDSDFTGDAEISFTFFGEGLPLGTNHRGKFEILSDQGEYVIPYTVTVETGELTSSEGPIRNIFHFVNLARKNWEEAKELFYSDSFEAILTDMESRILYRGFNVKKDSSANLDEFLVSLRKKNGMEYVLEDREFMLEVAEPGETVNCVLGINRNGWGYTRLDLETKGDFLFLEKNAFEEEDFEGPHLEIPFRVNTDLLHAGKNMGALLIKTPHEVKEVPVTVQAGSLPSGASVERKRLILNLLQSYEAFRYKRISRGEWIIRSEAFLDRLLTLDERDIEARLLEAQLFISSRRSEEADWVLNDMQFRIRTDGTVAEQAFYYYLKSLLSGAQEDALKAAEFTSAALENNPDNWRLRWLFLYVSDVLDHSPARKYIFLEEAGRLGAASPLIYLEAFFILKDNPSLLTSLEGFGQGLLYFGIRRGLMNELIVKQVIYLAGRVRKYSASLERLLIRIYEVFPGTDLLRVLVQLLMKRKSGTKVMPYYEEALKRDIHITGLYEAYLHVIYEEGKREIPVQMYLYFAEDRKADWREKAYLFASAMKNEKNIPEILETIRESVARFTMMCLSKGYIDQNLGFLYGQFYMLFMDTKENAATMAKLLFTRRIQVPEDVKKVVAVYENFQGEATAEAKNGEAYLPVYEALDKIFTEDEQGRRMLLANPSDLTPLCAVSRISRFIAPFATEDTPLCLYMALKNTEPNLADIPGALRVLREKNITPMARKIVFTRFFPLLVTLEDYSDVDTILSLSAGLPLSGKEKKELVSLSIGRGLYDVSLRAMQSGVLSSFDAKDVLKTGVRLLEKGEGDPKENEELRNLLVFSFTKDRYNPASVFYLCDTYPGRLCELEKLWRIGNKALERLDAEEVPAAQEKLKRLTERIFVQYLVTGSELKYFTEMYFSLKSQRGDPDILHAALYRKLYEAFVLKESISEQLYKDVANEAYAGGELPRIARLALLKYFAAHKSLWREELYPHFRSYLKEFFLEEGVVLPEFREYVSIFPELEAIQDKTILEYWADPRAKLTIQISGEETRFDTVFPGVYTKAFVLFPGEGEEYVIRIDLDGEITEEKGELFASPSAAGGSRYAFLSDILSSEALQDYETAYGLVFDYKKREFLAESLFRLR